MAAKLRSSAILKDRLQCRRAGNSERAHALGGHVSLTTNTAVAWRFDVHEDQVVANCCSCCFQTCL